MYLKLGEISSANSKFAENTQLKEIETIHLCESRNLLIHEKQSERYVNYSFKNNPKV